MRSVLACVLFATAVCTCAAQEHPTQTTTRTVVSGRQTQAGFRWALNPDCSSRGEIESRLLKKPEHGTVEFTAGTGFPNFPENSQWFPCNKQKVPGLLVMYKPEDGYTGKDSFLAEFIGPAGGDYTQHYFITVK